MKPWCSTKVDESGNHTAGHWGICGSDCPATSFDCKLIVQGPTQNHFGDIFSEFLVHCVFGGVYCIFQGI